MDLKEFLPDLEGGTFEARLAKSVTVAAVAAINSQKKSIVGVQFEFKPIENSRTVTVEHSITFTEPNLRGKVTETDTGKTVMYVNGNGSVTIMPDTQVDFLKQTQDQETES